MHETCSKLKMQFICDKSLTRGRFLSGGVPVTDTVCYCHINLPHHHSLVDGDLGGDLGPEAGVAHGHHGLLGLAVYVHVQHEAAEGGAQVVGQAVVKHAAQDQVHGQLAGHLVDGQVLAVQTHLGKQVELVSGRWMGKMERKYMEKRCHRNVEEIEPAHSKPQRNMPCCSIGIIS